MHFQEDKKFCEDYDNKHKKQHFKDVTKRKLRQVTIFDEADETDEINDKF